MHRTRRALLTATGTGAAALAGCLGGDGGATSATATGSPAEAPLPDDPSAASYATMGTAGPTVSYFGNWKCPFCAEFATGSDRVMSLGAIVSGYVEPGDLRLRYRGVAYTGDGEAFLGPDAPRATRAGLAVWEVDPASYWPYHEHVMANQPPESEQWATADRLVAFAREAGVDGVDTVRERITTDAYADRIEATTAAFTDANAEGTPTLLIDGELHSPFEPDATRSALDALVG